MMTAGGSPGEESRIGEVLTRVQLPLDNLEFAIDSYLEDNAGFLDNRTRTMLISVRDNLHRIARSTRELAEPPTGRGRTRDPDAPELVLEMLPAGG